VAGRRSSVRFSHPRRAYLLVLIIALFVAALAANRVRVLTALGSLLVVSDGLHAADVIVIAVDAGGAGVLEAADLVQAGVAPRVAVFADPPSADYREFLRRGIPYEDAAARSLRQLTALGVKHVERIPQAVSGTRSEGEVLPAWCVERGFRSAVFVTMPDHARRTRRVLHRAAQGRSLTLMIHPTRYSGFDPHRWWRARDTTRIAVVELQKLILDVVRHPFSG
jgi:hypothetical protein